MAADSRAVEWVLMYRKGLTAGRIADLCGVPKQKVTRALGRAKRREPELDLEHLANAPQQATFTPRWTARCEELARFVAENGRMPFAKGHGHTESSLGRWLAKQRAASARGCLNKDQRDALTRVGGWEANPRSQRDARRWQQRLAGLAEFVALERRFPSYRRPTSEAERVLGTWLHTQRQAAVSRQLPAEQLHAMDVQIPGWYTWRTPQPK